jgi:D-hexose-6-phosphate mutarotase
MSHDTELSALNERYALDGALSFVRERGGLIEAVVGIPAAQARIALQGAQVLEFRPTDEAPLLWLSENAIFEEGRGVRGGVPICWPWFGAHPDPKLPAHGFVRTRPWHLMETAIERDGVRLRFGIEDDTSTCELWPYPFRLRYEVHVSERLELRLVTHNVGSEPFSITEGLHTYLRVGDLNEVTVRGLEGCYYMDKTRGFARGYQDAELRFSGETDRIYLGSASEVVVDDPALDRRIRVAKSGSHSTVVWTPWMEKAMAFPDMRREAYKDMLCVEATNAGEDVITIEPGQRRTLSTTLSLERLP